MLGRGLCALAFICSLPLLLPNLDALGVMTGGAGGAGGQLAPAFLTAMCLAIMFTALAVLFVCLLKSTWNGLGVWVVRGAAALYILGYALVCLPVFIPGLPYALFVAAGVPLGLGAALLFMRWTSLLPMQSLRLCFNCLIAALLLAGMLDAIMPLLPGQLASGLLLAMAAIGAFAALPGSKANTGLLQQTSAPDADNANAASDWWDVFGKLDPAIVPGNTKPMSALSRALFFIATPLVVLLLFIVNRNMPVVLPYGLTPIAAACLLAAPCAMPLLFIKDDQSLINSATRLYLPLLAFCILAANALGLQAAGTAIMYVGVSVFCIIYALIMAAMVISMAGRMPSIALPASSLLLIALSLVAILAYTQVNAGALAVFLQPTLVVLFVAAVGLLLSTPGADAWRMMLQGVAVVQAGASHTATLAQCCEELAGKHALTAREGEILTYLGRGYSAAYIAELLFVAESTVRSHRKSIYRKLDIGSREELLQLLDSGQSSPDQPK
jgi:DNA-binding CsgD family transcriptional regulator